MKINNMASSDTTSIPSLKNVLSLLMDECDIDDISLSRETNIPISTISRMRLRSDSNPTASTLRPIAKFFSISISQLLGDEPLSKDRLPGSHNPTSFTSVRMPIIDWDSIADWIDNDGQKIKHKLTQWISTEKRIGYRAFSLKILTDSFGLAFRKGSLIIIDPEQKPSDGDLILLRLKKDGVIVLKQFLADGNDFYIRSVNPEMKGINLLDDSYTVIGVIIETRFSHQDSGTKSLQTKNELSSSFSNVFSPNPLLE